MRISDWSSDVCSSDLDPGHQHAHHFAERQARSPNNLTGRILNVARNASLHHTACRHDKLLHLKSVFQCNTLWVKLLEVNPVAASHHDIERRPRRLRASPTRHRLHQASDAGPSPDICSTSLERLRGRQRTFTNVH